MDQNRDSKFFLAIISIGLLLSILIVFAIFMRATTINSRDRLHEAATSEAVVITKNAIILATGTINAIDLANSNAAATRAFNSESTAVAQAATAEHQAISAATREQEAYQAWEQLLTQSLMANSRALMADIDVTNQELTQARLLAVEANRLSQEGGSPQEQAASQALLYTLATEKPDANHPLATLPSHFRRVNSVAWNHNGSRLASAADDYQVIIWDTESWQPVVRLSENNSAVYSVAWSKDGSRLASGSENNRIIIWDTETWDPIVELSEHMETVLSLAWNADGSRLASGSGENYPSGDNMIIIWDTESWEPVSKLTEHTNEVGSLAWNADSTRLASGSLDSTIIVWQADENQPQSWYPLTTLNAYSDVWNVAWNEDGSQLASASHNGTIIIWQTDETQPNSWQPLTTVTAPNGEMKSLAWNKEGNRLAASTCGKFDDYDCIQGEIIVWDTENWLPITTLSEHKSVINSVAWSEDGSRLASASGDYTVSDEHIDNTVVIWNTESWEPSITLDDSGYAYRLAWSDNGSYLATTKGENGVFIWQSDIDQPDNWKFLTALTGHSDSVSSIAWNREGNIFTSASIDGQIFNWDTENWQPLSQLNEHTSRVNSLAWNEDDSQLASAAIDGQIIIWHQDENNPNNWIPANTLTEHTQSVWRVTWTKDGSRLASASHDGTVIIWDTENWQPLATLEHPSRVIDIVWNEAGNQIASGLSDGTIIIWQTDEHQPNSWQVIATRDEHAGPVEGLAWKADGSRLASASDDGTVIIWDTEIWLPVATLTEHKDEDTVSDVAWDNHHDRLASTSSDGGGGGSVIVWNFPDFPALHCAMAGRNLSLAEWETYFPGVDYQCTCEEWPAGNGAPMDAPRCNNLQ
jgi:WD40 repeat protein